MEHAADAPTTTANQDGRSPWWTRLGLVALIVGTAAAVVSSEEGVPDTAGSIALTAACGGVLAAVTILARVALAPRVPRVILGVCIFLSTFCGYGAGLYAWGNGLIESWPFFAWGLIVGPLPMAAAAIPRAARHLRDRVRVYSRSRG